MSEAKRSLAPDEFLERSRRDRDFFFRNAIKIRPKDTRSGLIPLRMRTAQTRLTALIDRLAAENRPPRIVILKARQIGFSTVTDMEMFRRGMLYPLRQGLVAAHDEGSAEILFRAIHRAYDNLPVAVRPKKRFSQKKLIHFDANDSVLQVQVAREARGIVCQDLHVSELAFMKDEDANALLTAALQTVPQTPDSLVIVESTPNGIGNPFHKLYVHAKRGDTEWVPFFVPWFEEPTYRLDNTRLTLDELAADVSDAGERARELMTRYNLDLPQVAWWLYTLANNCRGDLDVMEQEYASNDRDCFLASGRKVFDRTGLAHYIAMSGLDPDSDETDDERERREAANRRNHSIIIVGPAVESALFKLDPRGEYREYHEPSRRHKGICGADISAGDKGSDPTPVVRFNRHTLAVDAVWYGRTPPEKLADIAAAIGYRFHTDMIVGEANNHGILFHHRLIDELHYPSIRWRRTSEDSVSGAEQDRPGFWTSGANREHLFNLVRRFVSERRGEVLDERMVREWTMLQYVKTPSGAERVDHPEDGYSDLTIALGMVLATHAGSFDGDLAPLDSAETAALLGRYDEFRTRRLTGSDTTDIDLMGLPLETVDEIEFEEAERAARSAAQGLGGQR